MGQAGCVEVSGVVKSASGSSQGFVYPLMPISSFCFNACICIIVAFFPDCLWGSPALSGVREHRGVGVI